MNGSQGKSEILSDIGEFGLIQRIEQILGPSSSAVSVGLGDDAATVFPPSAPLVVTTDAMVEGVHFRQEWTSPGDLAHKALASNLSDLAAKCARPAFYLIVLGLPPDVETAWVEDFYRALARLREEWDFELIGGDTVRSTVRFLSIAAWGTQTTPRPIALSGAQPGDRIFVTGFPGDAAAGLEILLHGKTIPENETESELVRRFLRPTPRIKEALAIAQRILPHSMTDISDGLARDLPKLCAASGVGAKIDAARLPCSESLRRFAGDRAAEYVWKGGEDYELLFTLSASDAEKLTQEWTLDCPLREIGEAAARENGIEIAGFPQGIPIGFDHFRE
ncbi:MAG: thiamine-phosphate kinase [Candidatus Omnitrophota bacterium]